MLKFVPWGIFVAYGKFLTSKAFYFLGNQKTFLRAKTLFSVNRHARVRVFRTIHWGRQSVFDGFARNLESVT